MFVRRIASVAAILGISLALASPVAAQDSGGSTVSLDLWTCNIRGGLPSLSIADEVNKGGVGRNCVEGAAIAETITLNGTPGTVTGSRVTWEGVSGDVAFSATAAAVEGDQQTIDGDTTLVATYYVSDVPPADVDDYPSEESDTPTEADTSDATTSDDEDEIADLPRTGNGPVDGTGTAFALSASGLVAAGVIAVAGSRAVRQQ